jgi:DNA repair protein RadD
MTELRLYQSEALSSLRRSLASGRRRPLLVMPTGSGKTVVAAELIRSASAKGRTVLFLAPRRELIYQTSQKLTDVGVDHGVIMAGEDMGGIQGVYVACIPTLHARAVRSNRIDLPYADLVMVDEAHIGVGGMAQELIMQYADGGSFVVGLTATPARTDGRGLGEIYDDLVLGPSVKELTGMGHLVPARYFVGESADLSGIKTQAGDYNQGQLGERVDTPKLVGDIVSNWARLCPDRQTFVFAVNIAHSRHLMEEFQGIGVRCEHIDGHTELEERQGIMSRLRTGDIQVLVNCQVMTYGVDFPPVSSVVLACPTKSITKYLQMVGRGLRPYKDKTDCMVLDHAQACQRLGFADDEYPWSLDGKEKVQDRKESSKKEPKEITCPECGATFRAARVCPNCGHDMHVEFKRAVEVVDADLHEVGKGKRHHTMDEKSDFFASLLWIARDRGYSNGWAAHKYREKFGVWPNGVRVGPHPPSLEVAAWVTSRQIAWVKAQKKAGQ